MPDSLNHARKDVLASIRASLGRSASPTEVECDYEAIDRRYKRTGMLSPDELLDLFARRLREYDAGVFHASIDKISLEIAKILNSRRYKRMVVPNGLESRWLPEGFDFLSGTSFDNYELDRVDGVITGCSVAIAETGSAVLQFAPGQGPRILSLIPDYHLCVVLAEQIVETVPEAFAKLEATRSLPTTFFSGPSATADIEMTRIKGVHGPRFLDVLLVI
ncbi:MAG: LUD domain-containing protein [Acidobacteriaceae bacterium]